MGQFLPSWWHIYWKCQGHPSKKKMRLGWKFIFLNPKIWRFGKIGFVFKGVMFRFHISFWGCRWNWTKDTDMFFLPKLQWSSRDRWWKARGVLSVCFFFGPLIDWICWADGIWLLRSVLWYWQESITYTWIYTPLPVAVSTRIFTFSVANAYKPSFATITGSGVDPKYHIKFEFIFQKGAIIV